MEKITELKQQMVDKIVVLKKERKGDLMSISNLRFDEGIAKINSNDEKPLDTLITEKTNTTNSGISTLTSIVNELKTGTIPVVKSVQRGELTRDGYQAEYNDINISSINVNKAILRVLPSSKQILNNDTAQPLYLPTGVIIDSTKIRLFPTGLKKPATYNLYYYFCMWEVIEFY